jgi:hypothetical protein
LFDSAFTLADLYEPLQIAAGNRAKAAHYSLSSTAFVGAQRVWHGHIPEQVLILRGTLRSVWKVEFQQFEMSVAGSEQHPRQR